MTEPAPKVIFDMRLDDRFTEDEILALSNGENKLMIASDTEVVYNISPTGVKRVMMMGELISEALVGTVDGINTTFTIPSGSPAGGAGLAFWNGRIANPDYSIIGNTVEFSVAPAVNTELWFVGNLALSGAGVKTFNARNGDVLPVAGDYDMSMISHATVHVTAATGTIEADITRAYIDYSGTGDVTITVSTARIAQDNLELLIVDKGGNANINNIVVATEGAETINGDTDGVTITKQYGTLLLVPTGDNLFIAGGAV